MRLGESGTTAGNVCPVEDTVPTTALAELRAEICTWLACNKDRNLRVAPTSALVKEDTVHVTDGFAAKVQTSTELVISTVLSVPKLAENVDRLTTSTVIVPTAGTLTKAATVSLFVSIFRPVVEVAGKAGKADNVRPEHVTMTDPADSFDAASRVMTSVRGVCV